MIQPYFIVIRVWNFSLLRDNTWKQLEGTRFPYMNDSDDPKVGSFFNGAIHWLAFHYGLLKNVILAFDLTERKLLESPPNSFFIVFILMYLGAAHDRWWSGGTNLVVMPFLPFDGCALYCVPE